MSQSIRVWGAVIIGLAFLALAAMYWTVPAGNLLPYVPGYLASSTHIHVNHGIASAVVGLLLWAYAWFASAKKVS